MCFQGTLTVLHINLFSNQICWKASHNLSRDWLQEPPSAAWKCIRVNVPFLCVLECLSFYFHTGKKRQLPKKNLYMLYLLIPCLSGHRKKTMRLSANIQQHSSLPVKSILLSKQNTPRTLVKANRCGNFGKRGKSLFIKSVTWLTHDITEKQEEQSGWWHWIPYSKQGHQLLRVNLCLFLSFQLCPCLVRLLSLLLLCTSCQQHVSHLCLI